MMMMMMLMVMMMMMMMMMMLMLRWLQVLIANNGMAATKAILSIRQWAYMELGDDRAIEFIVMATPEDLNANAEFIRLADRFVEVIMG
jgi:biotin carboxylase